MHPIQWPDIIIGVLIAEGLLHTIRSLVHFISRKQHNTQVMERIEQRSAALDQYRVMSKESVRAPLG